MLVDESPVTMVIGVILRFLLGLPADRAWRVETRSAHRSESYPDVRIYEPGYLRWAIRGAYAIIGLGGIIGIFGVIFATATQNVWYLLFAALSLMTLAATA
jgi:hypothetical protein